MVVWQRGQCYSHKSFTDVFVVLVEDPVASIEGVSLKVFWYNKSTNGLIGLDEIFVRSRDLKDWSWVPDERRRY